MIPLPGPEYLNKIPKCTALTESNYEISGIEGVQYVGAKLDEMAQRETGFIEDYEQTEEGERFFKVFVNYRNEAAYNCQIVLDEGKVLMVFRTNGAEVWQYIWEVDSHTYRFSNGLRNKLIRLTEDWCSKTGPMLWERVEELNSEAA